MNVENERSRSLWMETRTPRFGPLTVDAETEVLVIGAGIMGLTTAYELSRQGRRVMVLDRGRFARFDGWRLRSISPGPFEVLKSLGETRSRNLMAW